MAIGGSDYITTNKLRERMAELQAKLDDTERCAAQRKAMLEGCGGALRDAKERIAELESQLAECQRQLEAERAAAARDLEAVKAAAWDKQTGLLREAERAGVAAVEKPVQFEDCPRCRSNDVVLCRPPLHPPPAVYHCRACSAEWHPPE